MLPLCVTRWTLRAAALLRLNRAARPQPDREDMQTAMVRLAPAKGIVAAAAAAPLLVFLSLCATHQVAGAQQDVHRPASAFVEVRTSQPNGCSSGVNRGTGSRLLLGIFLGLFSQVMTSLGLCIMKWAHKRNEGVPPVRYLPTHPHV